jgi:hypothetical protein
VLSCRECNRGIDGKSSRLPQRRFLERLDTRNEFFINSHHPLRETIMSRTGETRQERVRFLNSVYETALDYLIHKWEPSFDHEAAF